MISMLQALCDVAPLGKPVCHNYGIDLVGKRVRMFATKRVGCVVSAICYTEPYCEWAWVMLEGSKRPITVKQSEFAVLAD